jgi:hypothetical protein
MSKLWKDYGLSITLTILFLSSWIAQGYFQWQEFVETQQAHRQMPDIVGFIPEFLSATFENWQSEFLQLLTFVVLTSFLIHKGSHESKDTEDDIHKRIVEIEKILKTKIAKR